MRSFAPGLLSAALILGSQTVAAADCECRAHGRLYRHGELACLRLPTGDLLARCDKVLNNSAWKKVRDGCPEASAVGSGSQVDGRTDSGRLPTGSDEAPTPRTTG